MREYVQASRVTRPMQTIHLGDLSNERLDGEMY